MSPRRIRSPASARGTAGAAGRPCAPFAPPGGPPPYRRRHRRPAPAAARAPQRWWRGRSPWARRRARLRQRGRPRRQRPWRQ
eukprot:3236178-Prymnesium_polylepis.1